MSYYDFRLFNKYHEYFQELKKKSEKYILCTPNYDLQEDCEELIMKFNGVDQCYADLPYSDGYIFFTINDIDIYNKGCGRCEAEYYGMNFYGKVITNTTYDKLNFESYEAYLDTYCFFHCKCDDEYPEEDIMLFKMYTNNNFGHWNNLAFNGSNILYTDISNIMSII